MRYSENLDYLIAAIIFLGTQSGYWGRTPSGLSNDLQLDGARLASVLETFPGIFRRTVKVASNGEHYFSLQARHAQREGAQVGDPAKGEDIETLEHDRLKLVIDFVTLMATHEQAVLLNRKTNYITMVSAIVAAIASLVAAFHK